MISASALKICCGDAVGTLSLTSGRVSCQGQEVSTTDFERIGGRASSKKWKQSVRVINNDGTAGKLIGDWLTERGLDIKNNKVIKLDESSLASQDSSSVPKLNAQPHSPLDVRRELATPINSKMHSVFSGSKPVMKGQVPPSLQHGSQSQSTLQHQQHANPDFSPRASAATLSYPPVQRHSMQGPAQEQSSQAQGASCGSVAALHKPVQAQLTDSGPIDVTSLQTSGQGPPSAPLRCLPALEHPGTSPQQPNGLQPQDPQRKSEPISLAGPLVAAQQTPVPTVPTGPPALAPAVQSSSALQQVPKLGPTPPLAAPAAKACAVQQLQQEPTRPPQADLLSADQQVSKLLPKRMLMHVPHAQPVEASKTDLLQHLQLSYPGLIPGDSTAELPKELVNMSEDSSTSSRTLIDIAAITGDELMAMSGSSADAPLSAMFPIPPGILPSREAHMTGHRPLKRQRLTIAPLSPDEAAAQIGQYMAGELKDEPWHAFGLGKAPTVAGRDLNLKQLYKAVQSFGGFSSCVANRSFAKVTTKLGIDKTAMTNASFLLRNHYTKFLLAYEQQMQILASAEGAEAGTDKALLSAPSWPTASSELAVGNGSSADEDAGNRSTAAPVTWSGEDLCGNGIALIKTSGQSEGIPPLQGGTAVAVQSSAVSLEAKVLSREAGGECPQTLNTLVADASMETKAVPSDAAPPGAGGLETPVAR